jgi:hypothetical protein
MSTTPSGGYNTISRVVVLIYRIFLACVCSLSLQDGVVEIYSFALALSPLAWCQVYMYRMHFPLES